MYNRYQSAQKVEHFAWISRDGHGILIGDVLIRANISSHCSRQMVKHFRHVKYNRYSFTKRSVTELL